MFEDAAFSPIAANGVHVNQLLPPPIDRSIVLSIQGFVVGRRFQEVHFSNRLVKTFHPMKDIVLILDHIQANVTIQTSLKYLRDK